jgi:hypothetical protein
MNPITGSLIILSYLVGAFISFPLAAVLILNFIIGRGNFEKVAEEPIVIEQPIPLQTTIPLHIKLKTDAD